MRPARLRRALAALIALPAVALAAVGDAPADYAARWPLSVPAGASLVRLPLTAAVLTRLQTADARDLRVFNAAGQAVPLAYDATPPAPQPAPEAAPLALPAMPLESDGAQASGDSLRVRIEADRAVTVQAHGAAPASAPAPVVGALVDARAVAPPLAAAELDAQWPEARPVTFHLHASRDLQQWQALGSATLYRQGGFATHTRVALNGAQLKDQYLRITWSGADGVRVQSVRLLPVAGPAPAERPTAALSWPAGTAPGALEFRLPFATPLAALDLRAEGSNTLVPVRVLARAQREQPWTPVAQHVVFNLNDGGAVRQSPPIELGQSAWREWRIEAQGTGFAAPPPLTAVFAPAQIVFVAQGAGPFTLAAAQEKAAMGFLPLASLMPGHRPGAQHGLPLAKVQGDDAAITVALAPLDHGLPTRQWLLWAVLLGGVLTLAAMAWALMRQLGRGDATPGQNTS
ncbi:DUF3999 family protein [Ottowia testudinis]|uniref:DUF3999 domain-containing protein n=1 Tax=Ottowia testudinis TaxID=2816950 RepID=A0A975CK51_9BURK|nr:DUF3999 family protein [Ottowia testudinis]QTD45674.1 DUF3999 domain-containing protein [Ottowia testudinis]